MRINFLKIFLILFCAISVSANAQIKGENLNYSFLEFIADNILYQEVHKKYSVDLKEQGVKYIKSSGSDKSEKEFFINKEGLTESLRLKNNKVFNVDSWPPYPYVIKLLEQRIHSPLEQSVTTEQIYTYDKGGNIINVKMSSYSVYRYFSREEIKLYYSNNVFIKADLFKDDKLVQSFIAFYDNENSASPVLSSATNYRVGGDTVSFSFLYNEQKKLSAILKTADSTMQETFAYCGDTVSRKAKKMENIIISNNKIIKKLSYTARGNLFFEENYYYGKNNLLTQITGKYSGGYEIKTVFEYEYYEN